MIVTHKEAIALLIVLKLALVSVGETNNVPAGQPVRGDWEVGFCS